MPVKRMDTVTIIGILLIGLAAGMLGGMVGVGGGLIVVPALVFFFGFSQHAAQGTSLGLLVLPVALFGMLNYYKQGYVDFRVVGLLAISFMVGSYFGSKWALSLPQETIKKYFAVLLFYTAFKLMGWEKSLVSWIRSWG
ncbi:MAG TPA: sulfite exporter TauE/SafE family protein [Lacibacter sp.]|nr:sulfite exporter TauE/SafE family protein [Lacibacter sp.]HMO87741.1 sulfite exporter TauE/SafE family protein [Lacibacter sp.]HMP85669.1 sulfite exporter TauE/SafE family protein [Lacibacter sp.]